jgi:hypothetical protein
MTRPGKLILATAVVLTIVLLVAHTFRWTRLKVDNVTLALVGILFVVPFLESVKKIRFGQFEAEIAPKEIAAVVTKASSDLPASQPEGATENLKPSPILDLVRQDPQMGLAKLRIDIEHALRALHKIGTSGGASKRIPSLSRIVNDLERSGNLSRDVAASLKDVLSIANRAVHGEFVTPESAEMLSSLGVRLLEELWDIYKSKVAEPLQSIPIDGSYLDSLCSSQYRVITAIPYSKKPVMSARILDQTGLDEFLEGYDEFAEFLISIEPIDTVIPESLRLLRPGVRKNGRSVRP